MSKIVVRHNFETNSSSMHSLSIRKESGAYSTEELMRSEEMHGTTTFDAIVILKDGAVESVEKMKSDSWIYGDRLHFYSSDMNFRCEPMEVLSTFRGKLRYALATMAAYRYKGWEERVEEIKGIFTKVMPDVRLDIGDFDGHWGRNATMNHYLLVPFMKKYGITMEEFLTNSKYVVIINYAEFKKMKWLNMVDENAIDVVFHVYDEPEKKLELVKGIWYLNANDISFGRSPFRVLGTPEGKARYALATYRSNNIDEVLAILQEVYPDMKGIQLPNCWYNKGDVDPGYCEDPVIPAGVPLRDFILDKKYVVISDGDEYCIWSDFVKTKMFKKDAYEPIKDDEDYDYYEEENESSDVTE